LIPLQVAGLARRYGRLVGLAHLDLELQRGQCVALIGANGSGKSTAVRTISGLLEPSEGSVRIRGHDPNSEPEAESARAALAVVPDAPMLYDDLTVRQHLSLVALAHGVTDDGTAVCLVNGDHPVAVGAGALLVYAGASRMLEPLRAETDQPGRVRVLLRAPIGKVLVQHALVPLVVVAIGALAAIAGCAALGALPGHGGAAALLAVLMTPAITLCAALSGRRGGRLPPSLLSVTYGDTSGFSLVLVVGWIVLWPLVAAITGAVAIGIAVHNGPDALPQIVIALVVLPGLLARGLAAEMFAP
jgi:ABC-type Fe3+/spermidine/putrescine transport system ATPase subunit